MLICQCDCFQIVKVSEAELKNRTACYKCEAKNQAKRFKPGDIAVYHNSIGEIAFGEQVIVGGFSEIENALEIEYRGRIYLCRPDEVESLGVNFYERRRSKKIRQRSFD